MIGCVKGDTARRPRDVPVNHPSTLTGGWVAPVLVASRAAPEGAARAQPTREKHRWNDEKKRRGCGFIGREVGHLSPVTGVDARSTSTRRFCKPRVHHPRLASGRAYAVWSPTLNPVRPVRAGNSTTDSSTDTPSGSPSIAPYVLLLLRWCNVHIIVQVELKSEED